MTQPISNDTKWEIDSEKPGGTNTAYNKCVDSSTKYGGEALKVGAKAVAGKYFGGAGSNQIDNSVDSSMNGANRAAKNWCVIS